MTQVFGDRVAETTTLTGTGNVTLAGAASGFRAFSAVATVNGDQFNYVIAGGTEWEVGRGTRLTATTFSRDVIFSNSAGGTTALNFVGAGVKDVFMDIPARHAQQAALAGAKNLVVNGGMEVSQANGSAGVGKNVYNVDMWANGSANDATLSFLQVAGVTLAPPGWNTALTMQVSGPDNSIGAAQFCVIRHPFEGLTVSQLKFGTADASPVGIGFWVRAFRAGIYCGSLQNGAQGRSYPFEFTINASLVWEFKTVVIPGDTGGTWPKDNTAGMLLNFAQAVGTNFQGTVNSWNAANRYGTANQVNALQSTSDTFSITGVSMLAGTIPPTPEMSLRMVLPYHQELARCQRYYTKLSFPITDQAIATGIAYATTSAWGHCIGLPTTMRISPSVAVSSPAHFGCVSYPGIGNVTAISFTSSPEGIQTNDVTTDVSTFVVGNAAVLVDNAGGAGFITADARM